MIEAHPIEKNEQGELLLNPQQIAKELFFGDDRWKWRYNGGWTKRLDAIDKKKTDGYSLVGPFVEDRLTWTKPGLYLDCDISGSRNHHRKDYRLFRIFPDGTSLPIETPDVHDKPDWAVYLWPAIQTAIQTAIDDQLFDEVAALAPPNTLRDDTSAMNAIHKLLDGVPWSPDDLDRIAEIVRDTGRKVRGLEEYEEEETEDTA